MSRAQDIFEIQVYEWETVPRSKWSLETHVNYIAKGTKKFEGTAAPTNHQGHVTFELTRGITNHFEVAGYLVLAVRPGGGFEFAGTRVRPRFSIPKGWGLPLDVGLSIELSISAPSLRAKLCHTGTSSGGGEIARAVDTGF